VVGYYGTPLARRGFLLNDGQFTEIDPPGSLTTLPSGIDNRGRVVGAHLDPNGINGRGFIWKAGATPPSSPQATAPTVASPA
jgi:hypothetical protein